MLEVMLALDALVGKCTGCGYKVKLGCCGCFPHDEIVNYWNSSKQRLKKSLGEAKKEAARIKAELAEGASDGG